MAAEGAVVVRIYSFDEGQPQLGWYGLYLGSSETEPSTLYNSDLDLSLYQRYGAPPDYDYGRVVTLFSIEMADVAPGAEYVEVEFTPLIDGVLTPIDPYNPPESIWFFADQAYSGGELVVGAYSGGEFVELGSADIYTYFQWDAMTLTAAPPPPTPRFWTGLQNAIELVDYQAPGLVLPEIGEYWTGEGGYYAGIWAHPSGDEYHMIVAPIEFDVIAANWTETYGEVPGARSNVNGPENTAALLALSKQAWAAEFCAGTTIDGHSDFYLMAGAVYGRDVDGGYEASEAKFIVDALGAGSSSTNFGSSGPQAFQNDFYWTSTELSNSGGGYSGYEAIRVRMTDGADNVAFMDADFCRVRPIRRIPV